MAAANDHPSPADRLEPHRWKPGESGNPGGRYKWRTELEKVVGNGQEMFELAHQLATGRVVTVREPSGRAYKESVSIRDKGRKAGYRREKQVVKIVPTAGIILQAQQMLLDRLYGRPMQQVQIDAGPTIATHQLLGELPEADRETLLAIAHRRLLGNGGGNGAHPAAVSAPEAIDVAPESEDPPDGSPGTDDPGPSEG